MKKHIALSLLICISVISLCYAKSGKDWEKHVVVTIYSGGEHIVTGDSYDWDSTAPSLEGYFKSYGTVLSDAGNNKKHPWVNYNLGGDYYATVSLYNASGTKKSCTNGNTPRYFNVTFYKHRNLAKSKVISSHDGSIHCNWKNDDPETKYNYRITINIGTNYEKFDVMFE